MRILTIAALAALAAPAALAADSARVVLPPAPVLEDSPETWYLRGEVGYVHHRRPDAGFTAAPFSGGLIHEGIGGSALAGIGFGYRFGPNLRADVTFDHRFGARFQGAAVTPAASLLDRGRFQSSALMLNGYVDIDAFMSFAPYRGAGVGVARGVLSDHARAVFDLTTGAATWSRIAGADYDLAWALMAGVGYQLSSGYTLDLGYRHVSLGDARTQRSGAGLDVESIGAHEMRIGIRYAFE